MDARSHHLFGPGPAVGARIDDWSRETARRMVDERYSAGTIIGHLVGYGLSFYASQALVREVKA